MSNEFKTDDEWIIHSINIHGYFFERWCQETIRKSKGWNIKETNYPVEFPLPAGPVRGKESKLDIYAEYQNSNNNAVAFLIECKKNNPEFVNWIFFKKAKEQMRPQFPRVARISNELSQPSTNWEVKRHLIPMPFSLFFPKGVEIIIADEAREAKGSYSNIKNNDKTKTSNAAITDASQQIALATQAVIIEQSSFSRTLGSYDKPLSMSFQNKLFIPAIVTTAKLFICEFEVENISSLTGEISVDKAQLKELQYLIFEFALPRFLQHLPVELAKALIGDTLEAYIRMPILIINSSALALILSTIATSQF